MIKIVDSVAPLGRPAVSEEGLFECGGRIGSVRNQLAMVDENGKTIIVGSPTIAGDIQDFRLSNFHSGKTERGEDSPTAVSRAANWRRSTWIIYDFPPKNEAGETSPLLMLWTIWDVVCNRNSECGLPSAWRRQTWNRRSSFCWRYVEIGFNLCAGRGFNPPRLHL